MSEPQPVPAPVQPKPLTLAWDPPPRAGAGTLAVVCAYRGRDGDARSRLALVARWLRRPQMEGHRIVHRDFYANPRDPAYLAGLVLGAADAAALGPLQVLLDAGVAEGFELPHGRAAGVEILDLGAAGAGARVRERAATFENVLLVFPDALGLGCERIERAALAGARVPVHMVNGRRRAFTLDRATRGALRWRRALARTRAPELLFAALAWPVAAACALIDGLRGGAPEEWHP